MADTMAALGQSNAIGDTLQYLRQRGADTRAEAANVRADKDLNMKIKMNDQVMEMNDMKIQSMKEKLMAERKEMARRKNKRSVEDFLGMMPTAQQGGIGESKPAMMIYRMAKMKGMVKPDPSNSEGMGIISQGGYEDLMREIQHDPQMSMRMATLQSQHWGLLVKNLQSAMQDEKIKDADKEQVGAQLQEAKQRQVAAINSHEKLMKYHQRVSEENNKILSTLPKDFAAILTSNKGGKFNFMDQSKKNQGILQKSMKQYQVLQAKKMSAQRTGKASDFMTAYQQKRRSASEFKNMTMAEFRTKHWSGEKGRLTDGDVVRLIADLAQYDQKRTSQMTEQYRNIRKESGVGRLEALNQVQKDAVTVPPLPELAKELNQQGIKNPKGKRAKKYIKNKYMTSDREAEQILDNFVE